MLTPKQAESAAAAILRLTGPFVLSLHSPGTGESGVRARLAFRSPTVITSV
jgi:hypothetical protein